MTAIDSGGKAGVTERAYTFWRSVRAQGLARAVMLVKGKGGRQDGPRLTRTYPDASKRKDRQANAKGEVPVWLLNTLVLKDALAADLERSEPGAGYIHFPAWLGPWFFDELTAETRTTKGWENLSNSRNEAFDLMVYNNAAMLAVNAERLNWDTPPSWADPAHNRLVIETETTGPSTPAAPKPPPTAAPKAARPVRFTMQRTR